MRESAVKNSPLPPSVEKAYHQKCIELKRRIRGVEDANDVARQRVHRLDRAIMKMRVNRAFLMDRLAKLQELNDSESEISSTRPSSPHEQNTGSKTRNRDEVPTTEAPDPSPARAITPDGHAPSISQSRVSTTQPRSAEPAQQSPAPPVDSGYHPSAPPPPSPFARTTSSDLPLIQSLPNGTSVMLIAPNTPKPAPWHINELDPRHHVHAEFEGWSLDEQEEFIFRREYLPFDKTGTPVLVEYDPYIRKYHHIFPHEPKWRNPIRDTVRKDSTEFRKRMPRPPPGPEEMYEQSRVPFADSAHGQPPGFTAANR